MEIKVYSRFDRPVIKGQTFSDKQPTYDLVIDPVTGLEEVKKVGETNIYAAIQEAAVGMEIQQIVEKYANGEIKPGVIDPANFADISNLPKDMLTAHMQLDTLRKNFEKTDLEFRKIYDFDFGKYVATLDQNGAGTKNTYEFLETLNKKQKQKAEAEKAAAEKENK